MRKIFAIAASAIAVLVLSASVAVALVEGAGDSPAATVLEELVEEGVITADQAEAIKAAFDARFEEVRQQRGSKGGRGLDTAAEVIGIDVETLRAALVEGATLAEVAEDNGLSRADLVDGLVEAAETRLAEAVENGDLTDEEAADKLAKVAERIEERVDASGPPDGGRRGPRGHGRHGHGPGGFGSDAASSDG